MKKRTLTDSSITTKKHIEELQRILVKTCLDFINKYGLRDIYALTFHSDNLALSAKFGEWQPETDSYIGVEGIHIEKHRLENGDIIEVPSRYLIGERL